MSCDYDHVSCVWHQSLDMRHTRNMILNNEGNGGGIGPILPYVSRRSVLENVAEFWETFTTPMTFRNGFYYDADSVRYTRYDDPSSYR